MFIGKRNSLPRVLLISISRIVRRTQLTSLVSTGHTMISSNYSTPFSIGKEILGSTTRTSKTLKRLTSPNKFSSWGVLSSKVITSYRTWVNSNLLWNVHLVALNFHPPPGGGDYMFSHYP
jgi:hypothetical protein